MVFRNSNPIALSLLVLLLVAPSCGKKGGEKETTGPGRVVISVGKTDITAADVDAETGRLVRRMAGRIPPEQMEQIRPQFVEQAKENLIHKILLTAAIQKEGVRITDTALDAKVAEFRGNFPDEATYQKSLESMAMSAEQFRDEVRLEIGIDSLLTMKTQDVPPADDAAIAKYYEENKEQFKQGEEVRASHILVIFEQGDDEAKKRAKREKAAAILDTLRAGGDFQVLAKRHSGCPSKENGGDLGYFARDRMVKPFEDAAFALGVGETSGVVETQFGYHIIKVMDKQAERIMPLEEVRAGIGDELTRQAKRAVIESYLKTLRDDTDIKIYPEQQAG
jgi:peptidyl-prolyl cis-trans isomerase C